MVPSDHDAGKAHAERPEDQQDAQGDGQHQVVEEEFGEHGHPAGVASGKGVRVHGQVVQEAGVDVVRALPLGQLLQTCHDHDIQEQGCTTGDTEGTVRDRTRVEGSFQGVTLKGWHCR